MKKRAYALLLAMMLLFGVCQAALSESGSDAETAYGTLKNYYNAGFNNEEVFDLATAIEQMKYLINYYNQEIDGGNVQLKEYSNAEMLFRYAQGVVAFSEGRYKDTVDYMLDCRLPSDLVRHQDYAPEVYRIFAQGMFELENRNYDKAYENLQAVNGALADDYYSTVYSDAMSTCRQGIKDTHLAIAKKALADGEYDTVREQCGIILNVNPTDAETLALLSDADKAGGNGPVLQEYTIKIKSAKAKGQNSVLLEWEGEPETYTVTWTPDLERGENARSETVSGHEYQVTDLYPGTLYRFTVEYQGCKDTKDKATNAADPYTVDDGSGNLRNVWTGSCTIYDYPQREEYLDSETASYEFLEQNKRRAQQDTAIHISDVDTEEHFLLFVFTTTGLPEDIAGKEYALLFHVDEIGTFVQAGQVGDPNVCVSNRRFYAVMYDPLDVLAEKFEGTDKINMAYTLDLLVEGKLAGSVTGTLE